MTSIPFRNFLSKAVRIELERVAILPKPWIVADMDSTLIRKERGVYPDLNDSPCKSPLIQWLKTGGQLLVVTSDEGHRPFRQLLGQIPIELRHSIKLAAGEGAAMYIYNEELQTYVEDLQYLKQTQPSLPSPVQAISIACEIKRDFMLSAYLDRTLLKQVTPESRKISYKTLFNSTENLETLKNIMTNEYMLKMGALPKFRGSMIWRNNSKIPKGWDPDQKKKEKKGQASQNEKETKQSSVSLSPSTTTTTSTSTSTTTSASNSKSNNNTTNNTEIRWTTMWILGIGNSVSKQFITAKCQDQLSALGISAEIAPNSILLKNKDCSKALPIEYSFNFLKDNAIAFGDNPKGNDLPMTKFGDRGLPFVSVAVTMEDTPKNVQHLFVGGLENGTADCLTYMNQIREEHHILQNNSKI